MGINMSAVIMKNTSVMEFAMAELERFLPDFERNIELTVDSELPAYSFAGKENASGVVLCGADEACVLHAVYTMLEMVGWRFEITGPVRINQNVPENIDFQIEPAVKLRGIRQHINFPMDISSYPLEEAKEYIRNLARLRYNHITFHSYPNQWIDGPQEGNIEHAGELFYGLRYDIPEHPLLKRAISNKKTFCIPAIEPYYDDVEVKSRMAIEWLREVMIEAKKVGMHIQFSFEPRGKTREATRTLITCRHIIKLYPQIDTLELISTETGGWGEASSPEEVRKALDEHYSRDLQSEPEFTRAINSGNANFDTIMGELGHLLASVQEFTPEATKLNLKLSLGIYCVLPEFHPAIFRVLHERLPQNIGFAILAGHSSGRVADFLQQSPLSDDIWSRTMIYSWLEFDGTMYLQQNGIPGIERLLKNNRNKMQSVAFNHWRTAENQLVARYAAETCLTGLIPAKDFYTSYAETLGISNPAAFTEAHEIMSKADWIATNELFNIGFCFAGCWGRKGLGYFENWSIDRIYYNHDLFGKAHKLLAQCARQTTAVTGRNFLSFLENRVRCTMVYLKAMAKGSELQQFKNMEPEDLNNEQKTELTQICDRALASLEQYMTLHVEAMPDRGCEGTLISIYYTPPVVLKRIREEFAGIPSDQPHISIGHDEPPSPIEW